MKNNMRKLLSFILCIVLIAAMALLATGCTDNKKETPKAPDTTQVTTAPTEKSEPTAPTEKSEPTEATKNILDVVPTDVTTKGEGQTSFKFEVTDLAGKTTKFLVKTDKTIVGDALQEVGLITGDPGPYGLYVKSVNGITADYDKDGSYWAFYENGEYGLTDDPADAKNYFIITDNVK